MTRDIARERTRHTLRVEFGMHRGQYLSTLVLALLSLLIAVLWTDALTALAPLWAALAWQRHGRDRTAADDDLAAALGVSRADRIRGRALGIAAESAMLVAVWLLGGIVADLRGHSAGTFGVGGLPSGVGGAVVMVCLSALVIVLVLALVGGVVGQECLVRRPGWGMYGITVIVLIGASIVSALVVLGAGALSGGALPPEWTALAVLAVVAPLAVLGLRARIRRWIRELDERRDQVA